jgi:hypothetical protein
MCSLSFPNRLRVRFVDCILSVKRQFGFCTPILLENLNKTNSIVNIQHYTVGLEIE